MSSSKSNIGVSWSGVLFIIFLILKLTNNIDWSWVWVTSPLWIPIALLVSLLLIGIVTITFLLIFGVSLDKITSKIEVIKKTLNDKS